MRKPGGIHGGDGVDGGVGGGVGGGGVGGGDDGGDGDDGGGGGGGGASGGVVRKKVHTHPPVLSRWAVGDVCTTLYTVA